MKADAKESTCTESGNRAYFTCTDCDKVFTDAACTAETTVEAQVIAPLAHDWGEVCTEPYEIVFTNDGESFTSTGYYIRLAVNENVC